MGPTSPERHYSIGIVAFLQSDWRTVSREYQDGAPLVPYCRRSYAYILLQTGDFERALVEIRKTLEVDPLGVGTNQAYAQTLYWTRQYDDAIVQLNRTIDLDPDFAAGHELLAEVYTKARRYGDGIKELARAVRLGGDADAAANLEMNFVKDGFESAVRRYYKDQLEQMLAARQLQDEQGLVDSRDWVSPMSLALLSIKAGERESAFDWLEKAREERQPWLTYLRVDPVFDPLRDDPRFDALVKKVGVPWTR